MTNPLTLAEMIAKNQLRSQGNSDRLDTQEALVKITDDGSAIIGFESAHIRLSQSGEAAIVCLIDGEIREIPIQLIWDKLFPKEIGRSND